MTAAIRASRSGILSWRRRVGALDRRLPHAPASLRTAAWAGLQDSVPRAAVLSLHARVAGIGPLAWSDPAFVQLWGPRHAVFVVPAEDVAVFGLGTLPEEPAKQRRAIELADALETYLAGRREEYASAGRGMGVQPQMLRYAGATGRVLVAWDGARRPLVWTVPAPAMDPLEARAELVRRYLHVCGPQTPAGCAWWAGLRPAAWRAVATVLADDVVTVRTPLGDAWMLASDVPGLEQAVATQPEAAPDADAAAAGAPAGDAPVVARILSSGDPYLMAHDRALLVPDAAHRRELWPAGTVWPGGLLVGGELVGSWRRSQRRMSIRAWRPLTEAERAGVEAEAAALPLPDPGSGMTVTWA